MSLSMSLLKIALVYGSTREYDRMDSMENMQ